MIPENNWNQKRHDILKNEIDIFTMGNDWEGKFNDLTDICDVIYLPRTPNISATKIKLINNPLSKIRSFDEH